MWNFRQNGHGDTETGGRGEKITVSPRLRVSASVVLLLTAHCSLLTGCRRDMQDQPKTIAYRENAFYKDGAARPPVEGTVPRGYLRADREFYLGKKNVASSQPTAAGAQAVASSASAKN